MTVRLLHPSWLTLPQRLRLAPVALQVLALRHHQSFLAGGQHFLFACAPVGGVGVGLEGGRDGSLRWVLRPAEASHSRPASSSHSTPPTAHPGIDERERTSDHHYTTCKYKTPHQRNTLLCFSLTLTNTHTHTKHTRTPSLTLTTTHTQTHTLTKHTRAHLHSRLHTHSHSCTNKRTHS